MGAVGELLRHDRVHGYHHIPLFSHGFIPIFDLQADPCLERFTDHCGADVDDPLLRCLRQVDIVWQEVGNISLIHDELQDLFDAQGLVLRHVEVLDLVIEEVPLLLVQDVLQEVDGGVVCNMKTISQYGTRDLPYGGIYA